MHYETIKLKDIIYLNVIGGAQNLTSKSILLGKTGNVDL